jgi:hypothetical protein
MIHTRTSASIHYNTGIEALWFLLGHICSYYSVLLATKRGNNIYEQWTGLIWLGKKSDLEKKAMKRLASYKSVISWQLA